MGRQRRRPSLFPGATKRESCPLKVVIRTVPAREETFKTDRASRNKRMRGRNRKGPNPLTRSYESNGPDVKIRGTALHIAEKYMQLRAMRSPRGDRVAGESYLQHAEHYYRIVAAAQAQMPRRSRSSATTRRATTRTTAIASTATVPISATSVSLSPAARRRPSSRRANLT